MPRSDSKDPKSDADVKTEVCPKCHGTGSAPLVAMSTCATCLGAGRINVPEPVDTDAIPYIETLVGAGDRGFAPIGWLYLDVMRNLCRKGFAYSDGHNCFRVSDKGRAELEKHRRNEARRPPKEAAP